MVRLHRKSRRSARYPVRRLGSWLLSLWLLVTVSFALIQLTPGDPARAALGDLASPEALAEARTRMGLDRPLFVRYFDYLADVLRFDLGESTTLRAPVRTIIFERLPVTLTLAVLSVVIVLVAAVVIGIAVAARTQGGRKPATEVTFTGVTGVVYAMPEFVLGVLLVLVFSLTFKVLPVAGLTGPSSYVLPVVALSLGSCAGLARIVRVESLRVLQREYMLTAKAKRLRPGYRYLVHVVPNVLTATLTIAGLIFTGLVSGTVVVENLFALPGLGSTIVQAIQMKDFPLVQGLVLVLGGGVLLVNLLIDLAIGRINPRAAAGMS